MFDASEFEVLAAFLKKHSGYFIGADQAYVLESRLPAILSATGCKSTKEVIQTITTAPEGAVADLVLQIMTVNETMFFRDYTPFSQISDHLLPTLTEQAAKNGKKHIDIWCCACSSGQEPYSLAILLDEEKSKYPGFTFSILATDISGEMVERAKKGIYSEFETMRGLSPARRAQYFKPIPNQQWQVKETLQKMMSFDRINLLNIPAGIGKFDIVLCRNVLIYFDQEDKQKVLSSLYRTIKPHGYLMTGSAEMVANLTTSFQQVSGLRGIYHAA